MNAKKNSKTMTDSELLRLLRAIDRHNSRVTRYLERIRQSSRADAKALWNALVEQCSIVSSAEHVGGTFLGKVYVNKGGTYVRR